MNAWELSFYLNPGVDCTVARILCGDAAVLTVSRSEHLRAEIATVWRGETPKFGRDPSFTFALTSPKTSGSIRICWRGYSFQLYVDGQLEDEEWPLGNPAGGAWTLQGSDQVSGLTLSECAAFEEDPEALYTKPFQNFVLPGHNTGVGDCMPYARDGRWCLYYLLDRRGHASKRHLGAHQWAQVSTSDLKTWVLHPLAIGITEQWEGSICTGSLIEKDGRIYAFYAVRMSDDTPARLTWAVSDDGVRFEKSGRYFALTAPYEPVSARDPMVFYGADSLYHMLVTTNLADAGRFGGCLAHLTSPDLTDWTQHEPFIVPGYSDQPECSDYFEWNGWYYLVFSNFAIGRYRMSRSPFGPWLRPENDHLDALEIQVPKTAPFGDRRFSTGFLCRRPRTYSGNAVTHELFQRPYGTLGVKHLEEILPVFEKSHRPKSFCLEAGQGRAAATLPETRGSFRLKAAMKPGSPSTLFGLILTFGENSYRIEFDPAARTAVIARPREDFRRGEGRDLLKNLDLMDSLEIDLLVDGDILDLMLSGGRVMTMRLDDFADAGVRAEFYAIAGTFGVSDVEFQFNP